VMFNESDRKDRCLNKYLSFSAAPGKEYVEVTKRMSESAFSGRLRSLKPGDRVLLKGPLGNCVFDERYRKISFLIGGIGITPVISILEYVAQRGLDNDIVLLYSNRTEEEIAFRKELDRIAALSGNIKVKYIVTDCEPRDRSCSMGRIDGPAVEKAVQDIRERVVFVFGPPGMVDAIKKICLEMGVPSGNLKTENFVGY
ncbi:MAG: hypothetical protein PHW14_05555, partial [Candidatus Omnitrophica bacterium]|nr:hypothetical protein [Candidatus Omnitrophota bacterium]